MENERKNDPHSINMTREVTIIFLIKSESTIIKAITLKVPSQAQKSPYLRKLKTSRVGRFCWFVLNIMISWIRFY